MRTGGFWTNERVPRRDMFALFARLAGRHTSSRIRIGRRGSGQGRISGVPATARLVAGRHQTKLPFLDISTYHSARLAKLSLVYSDILKQIGLYLGPCGLAGTLFHF